MTSMPSVPLTGGSGGSRPQRSELSASGATPHVLRRLPGQAPRLPTHAEGGKGHSRHRLERTRFLLQKRPGRGGLRRRGAASLPSAAPVQHSRILGVAALGRGDRFRAFLERRSSKRAGPAARSGAPTQGGPSRACGQAPEVQHGRTPRRDSGRHLAGRAGRKRCTSSFPRTRASRARGSPSWPACARCRTSRLADVQSMPASGMRRMIK